MTVVIDKLVIEFVDGIVIRNMFSEFRYTTNRGK